jgi:hypothetical protein
MTSAALDTRLTTIIELRNNFHRESQPILLLKYWFFVFHVVKV